MIGWPLDFSLQCSQESFAVTKGTGPGRQPLPDPFPHLLLNQWIDDELQVITIHLAQGGFFIG